MRKLTKAEEQIMHILWDMEEGLVRDIIARFPDPKPAYNTVSTVVRILEKKGFVGHKAYGNTYLYHPLVPKDEYAREHFKGFIKDYFNNSFPKMAAFFVREYDLDISELERILKLTEEELKKSKPEGNE